MLINVASSEFQGQVHKNLKIKAGQNAAPSIKAAASCRAAEASLGTPSKVKAMAVKFQNVSRTHTYTLRNTADLIESRAPLLCFFHTIQNTDPLYLRIC